MNINKLPRLKNIFGLNVVIIIILILMLVFLTVALVLDNNNLFVPGETSKGHLLFEVSCTSCHEGFKPVSNDTCMRCHEAELAKDVHGAKKFRDPRWAELISRIDVLTCTACHNEHVHIFSRGVHLPLDLCMNCHQGIVEGDLASHNGFATDGCWTAGCHNYHDHRSISTGFLRRNIDQPNFLPVQTMPARTVEAKLEQAPTPDLEKEFLGG